MDELTKNIALEMAMVVGLAIGVIPMAHGQSPCPTFKEGTTIITAPLCNGTDCPNQSD